MGSIVPPALAAGKLGLRQRPCRYILNAMQACVFCKTPIPNPREVYRSTTCSGCGRDLKICLNCRFYSPGAHWDCSESIDEPVRDKDRANFCTFFVVRDSAGPDRSSEDSRKAKRKIDQLFGDESP